MLDRQQRRRQLVVRTLELAVFVGVLFAVVVVGYWYTQVLRGSQYRELAENNRLREQRIRAPRGLILDREGQVLVENVPSYSLLLNRARSPDLASSLRFLARVLDEPRDVLEQRLQTVAGSVPWFRPLPIAEGLSLDEVAGVEAAALEHPELSIDVEQRRFYRHGPQTAHVVGYLSEASEETIARRPGLKARDLIGVKGVEQTYDSVLRGEDGRRVVVVDSRGKLVREELREPGRPGRDLELSLDLRLQQEAERFFQDKVGSAVALDPRNGEILAMVSSPSFNPNDFARRMDSEQWEAILLAPHQPLQNRALQNSYPPGSLFKIVASIAALEEGVIGPDETVSCSGATRIYNHRYRCWRRGGHGRVSMRDALRNSCDVFFYHLGARLGIDRIARWAQRLGLGQLTGIDLVGEKSGLVPDRQWSLRRRGTIWFPGETISVVIGQGPLLTTPLQMAVMTAAVANGGDLVRPHLVRGLRAAERSPVGLSSDTLDLVHHALWQVVNEGGTGGAARVRGLDVAGKTGTAQVIRQETRVDSGDLPFRYRDHAWFTSFAPVDDPRLVVVVFVEHGGHGGSSAAPLAKLLYERYFGSVPDAVDT